MMIDEKNFKEQFGTRNPFTVPEGYFDRLQDEVMAKIPEKQTKIVAMKPRHFLLRPLIGVAASACIVVCGFAAYSHFFDNDTQGEIAQETSVGQTSKSCEAEDYIMMDNEDMYSYMMEQ